MTQGLTIYPAISGDTLLSLQVHQKRPGCPTCDNTFISLGNFTVPFIFTRPASINDITSFTIKDSEDNTTETLDNSLISIINAGDVDYIVCNFASLDLDSDLPCDHYYYELTFDTEVYYSEMFRSIGKGIELSSADIAVNGDFATDLSGWTVVGATWISAGGGRAQLATAGESIAQAAPGNGLVQITVTVLNTFTSGMEFIYGSYILPLVAGDNIFYVPSGIVYTIKNNDTTDFNALYVDDVQIYQIERIECYNLIVARNSCNKNGIPYLNTGYTDVIIIDAELYEPEYLREDQIDQNGNRDNSQTFMRIDKKWTLKTTTQNFEPLVDELSKLPANDCIYIFNDIWKKSFIVFEGSMDIEIGQEWLHEDKCNASVSINIMENLVLNSQCCEEIQDIECCDSFLYEYQTEEIELGITEITITIPDGNCAGLIYKLLTFTDDVYTSTTIFEHSITFQDNIIFLNSYQLMGSKWGCPDILYTSLS